jgi:diketogulonate reductase-like aldo/keto reductase
MRSASERRAAAPNNDIKAAAPPPPNGTGNFPVDDARERCFLMGGGGKMDLTSTVKLSNGVDIPWVGLGVFKSPPGGETEQAVRWALEIGYRHIDTAALYENEADVGRALKGSGVPREKVFVTTKVWNTDQGYERTLKAFDRSRKNLGLDVVDLYLVHWPIKGKYRDTWKALEKLLAERKVRAIGVSNFLAHHLEDLMKNSTVMPAVNQVEFHPFLVQEDLLAFDARARICHEAWSPLTRGKHLDNPVITELARKYGKTPAQIVLRWDLELGVVTIPKSVHRERILENSQVFDFELAHDDVARISALDAGTRIGPHPDNIS